MVGLPKKTYLVPVIFIAMSLWPQTGAAAACNHKGKGPGCSPPKPALVTLAVYFDDFEASSKGWRPATTGHISGDTSLGGYCNFSTGALQRTYPVPLAHQGVRIRATVHLLDRWQGEEAFLSVDGTTVWNTSHHHCPMIFPELCSGINVTGDPAIADKLGEVIDVFVPHTADTLTVAFSTGITRNACEASLAVDDVEISVY